MADSPETPQWEGELICFKPKVPKKNKNFKDLQKVSKPLKVKVFKDRLTVSRPGKKKVLRTVRLADVKKISTDEKLPDLVRIFVEKGKGKMVVHQFQIVDVIERKKFINLVESGGSAVKSERNETSDTSETTTEERSEEPRKKRHSVPSSSHMQRSRASSPIFYNHNPSRTESEPRGFPASNSPKEGFLSRQNRPPYKSSLKTTENAGYSTGLPSEQQWQTGFGCSKNHNYDYEDESEIRSLEPPRGYLRASQVEYSDGPYEKSDSLQYRHPSIYYADESTYSESVKDYDNVSYERKEPKRYSRDDSEYSSSTIVERPAKPKSLTYYLPFLPIELTR